MIKCLALAFILATTSFAQVIVTLGTSSGLPPEPPASGVDYFGSIGWGPGPAAMSVSWEATGGESRAYLALEDGTVIESLDDGILALGSAGWVFVEEAAPESWPLDVWLRVVSTDQLLGSGDQASGPQSRRFGFATGPQSQLYSQIPEPSEWAIAFGLLAIAAIGFRGIIRALRSL